MIIVKRSKQVKVYFIVVENVRVQTHQPNQVNKIPQASPNGKSPFEVVIRREVDVEKLKDEQDCEDY